MSEPERMGDQPDDAPRSERCSGALLVVDLEAYRSLERTGVRFATRSTEFREQGQRRLSARVACEADVLAVRQGGRLYFHGLCASCAGLETEQRRDLRSRQPTEGR